MAPSTHSSTAHKEHPFVPFLQSQPQNALTRLYSKPSSCLAIFRLLSPVERQIIMNLLWLESAVSPGNLAAWVTREGKAQYDAALSTLARLHILPASSVKFALNAPFRTGLRQAITGGGSSGSFGTPAGPADFDGRSPPTIATLDAYALERWEASPIYVARAKSPTILHYMVSSGTAQRPSHGIRYLLAKGGLMTEGRNKSLSISSAGFQFLLHSPHEQLWHLLLQYVSLHEERKMDLVELLHFLFMLSTMELGREYSSRQLTGSQRAMLNDFYDYGLVWRHDAACARFSPTRLATTLSSSSPPLPTTAPDTAGPQEGFIILETNYRIYAYTDNPLQTAVLDLFTHLKYRLPNLVVGVINRDSVKKALANGISADQIISYLVTHAHANMRKNDPLLPVTVQDQIRLWELERNRTKFWDGLLISDFAAQSDYELVLKYAKDIDVVLYENAVKRCFFCTEEGYDAVKAYIDRRRSEHQQLL